MFCDSHIMGNQLPKNHIPNEPNVAECLLCKKKKPFITFHCGHTICIKCLRSMKFFDKETWCIVCNTPMKIEKVAGFNC